MIKSSIKYSNGAVDVSCQFNKRLALCFLYLRFDTSEKSLLYVLLKKYIHEKVTGISCNAVNEIYSAQCTSNGIVVTCSEKKIIPNIINIFAYLMKTKLSSKEHDNLTCATAKYSKLHNDLKSFSVFITGKTRNISRAFANSGDKKITKIVSSLDNVQPKDIEDVSVKHPAELVRFDFKGSGFDKVVLALMLEDTPFVFAGDKIICIDKHTPCDIDLRFHYDYVLGKVKNFFNSCGAPGVPAANDTGGAKHKEKCANILECLNSMLFILSDLHGFSYKVDKADSIKGLSITPDLRSKLTELKKTLSSMAP